MVTDDLDLTDGQREQYRAFEVFAERHLAGANQFDRDEALPPAVLTALARARLFGLCLSDEYGGCGRDFVSFGLLNHAIARACSSTRSILTVHTMVALAIARWGTPAQKAYYLPRLSAGDLIAALCVTEPEVGSDAASVQMIAAGRGGLYTLRGVKCWVSGGQVADVLVVLASLGGRATAFLVDGARPGLERRPVTGLLGVRASLVAELTFHDVPVSSADMLGRPGFGFSHVISTALHYGRYSVAWGCAGSMQACLTASLEYTRARRQFGVPISQHQLVQAIIADMATKVRAAHLLCHRAGVLIDRAEPAAVIETMIAKYFCARAGREIADAAVQLHGARGCSAGTAVQRHLRDAKVAEIVEGTTQLQQITIGASQYQRIGSAVRAGVLP